MVSIRRLILSYRRLILSYTMQQVIPNICTKFQNPRCSCSWEIFDTNFPKEKREWQIKGMISRRRLILSYTIQQVIPNICTKFQNPRFSSSCKIFDEKKKFTHTHANIVTEKTKTIYPLYTSYTGGIIKSESSCFGSTLINYEIKSPLDIWVIINRQENCKHFLQFNQRI